MNNNTYILAGHITSEILVIAGLSYYFNLKINKVNSELDLIKYKLEQLEKLNPVPNIPTQVQLQPTKKPPIEQLIVVKPPDTEISDEPLDENTMDKILQQEQNISSN